MFGILKKAKGTHSLQHSFYWQLIQLNQFKIILCLSQSGAGVGTLDGGSAVLKPVSKQLDFEWSKSW